MTVSWPTSEGSMALLEASLEEIRLPGVFTTMPLSLFR